MKRGRDEPAMEMPACSCIRADEKFNGGADSIIATPWEQGANQSAFQHIRALHQRGIALVDSNPWLQLWLIIQL